jgi:hypothetical protein
LLALSWGEGLALEASPSTVTLHPAVTISVNSGTPGTHVTIIGTDFPPSEIVALYIDLPYPYLGSTPPGPRADAHGGFQDNFDWPGKNYDPNHRIDPAKPGPHQVCGDTGYPGNQQPLPVKACAMFQVSAPPSPTPNNPSSSSGANLPEVLFAVAILLAVVAGTLLWVRRGS